MDCLHHTQRAGGLGSLCGMPHGGTWNDSSIKTPWFLFVYLFIGCAGSFLLLEGFL